MEGKLLIDKRLDGATASSTDACDEMVCTGRVSSLVPVVLAEMPLGDVAILETLDEGSAEMLQAKITATGEQIRALKAPTTTTSGQLSDFDAFLLTSLLANLRRLKQVYDSLPTQAKPDKRVWKKLKKCQARHDHVEAKKIKTDSTSQNYFAMVLPERYPSCSLPACRVCMQPTLVEFAQLEAAIQLKLYWRCNTCQVKNCHRIHY